MSSMLHLSYFSVHTHIDSPREPVGNIHVCPLPGPWTMLLPPYLCHTSLNYCHELQLILLHHAHHHAHPPIHHHRVHPLTLIFRNLSCLQPSDLSLNHSDTLASISHAGSNLTFHPERLILAANTSPQECHRCRHAHNITIWKAM
jgi:hypothetical protein